MFPTKFGAAEGDGRIGSIANGIDLRKTHLQRRRMACDVLSTLQNKSSACVVGEGGVPRARTILGALQRRSRTGAG